ncbi:hypothetical protein O181_083723 [Austropuccinia psidii MF-1]|uniref:Uncharacterized protein n=1 Tax=Austropuccinia psidii MF-1 TaxID=1389203 RepID=A0A9Q3FPX1_9BASI|nr:hypothetical protein [Austropuccinia psidii MF-1]
MKKNKYTPKISSGLPHPSGHLTRPDYLCIINWLTHKSNFDACFGTGGSTLVGRPPSSKKNGFHLMAIEVNKKSQHRLNLSATSIGDQWHTYKKKYTTAKKFENLTWAGITEEDEKKGMHTMSDKLESMCPCFAEMDSLFGHKPNVTPLATYDSQEDGLISNEDEEEPMEHKDSAITEEGTITIQQNMDIAKDKLNDHVEEPKLQDKINGSSQKRKHSSSFNLNNTSGTRKKLSDVLYPSYSQIMIDWQKGREAHDEAWLEWDKQKWNEERNAQIMKTEQQRLMKEMEITFEWEKNAECRKL